VALLIDCVSAVGDVALPHPANGCDIITKTPNQLRPAYAGGSRT